MVAKTIQETHYFGTLSDLTTESTFIVVSSTNNLMCWKVCKLHLIGYRGQPAQQGSRLTVDKITVNADGTLYLPRNFVLNVWTATHMSTPFDIGIIWRYTHPTVSFYHIIFLPGIIKSRYSGLVWYTESAVASSAARDLARKQCWEGGWDGTMYLSASCIPISLLKVMWTRHYLRDTSHK